MKLKLIAVAALAVCGSGAFAQSKCNLPATSTVDLVTGCAPEVTLYMAGASAQIGAINTLLQTTDSVFDTSKAIAKVNKTSGLAVPGHANAVTTDALATGLQATVTTVADLGAKNTEIWVGTGSNKMGPAAGKRIAVVYNYANGSFAGVKQMTEAKGSGAGEELSQGLLTVAQQKANTRLACVRTSSSEWTATNGSGAARTVSSYTAPTYACAGNAFNYLKAAPAGGTKGVQLALADVGPNQASLGVLTPGKWTAAKFPMTSTAMQGFGVLVNDNALRALIKREVAAKRLPDTCVAANIYGSDEAVTLNKAGRTAVAAVAADPDATPPVVAKPAVTGITANPDATILTAACQPSVTYSDMAALVTGKATAALISGDAADVTPIAYYRRVPMSGTQASSNIIFAGQASIEGFKASDVISGKVKPGMLKLSDAPNGPDSKGTYTGTSTDGKFLSYAATSSSVVTDGVSGDKTNYAFGVGSLGTVWKAAVGSPATGLKGASYVKIEGISPNFYYDGDGKSVNDDKHRVGMLAGYPFQFEMVAIKNAANSKVPLIAAVVDGLVTGMQDPAYNLAGIAYIDSSDTTKNAKYIRGNTGNAYTPLNLK